MKKQVHLSKLFSLVAVLAVAMGVGTLRAQVVTYTFLTCGATGNIGPNQGQVTSTYGPTNLSGLVTVSGQGAQQFVVPSSGLYKIAAYGAEGASVSGFAGGLGATIIGDVTLTAGQILTVWVGQMGTASANGGGGGGASGAAVAGVPLVIAGGGGGASGGGSEAGKGGVITNAGGNSSGQGGTGGAGGQKGWMSGDCGWSGGGGGFSGNGYGGDGSWDGGTFPGTLSGPAAGMSAVTSGVGGIGGSCGFSAAGTGGFGCGGGGRGEYSGGGGGGYSGGAGGHYTAPAGSKGGGGGGSFNSGTNQVNTPGNNSGNGKVVLTRLCNISLTSSSNPICFGQSVTLTTDAASGITWSGSPSTGNSIVVTPNSTTSYSVAGTSTANCAASSVITITVNPLPSLSTIVTPTTLCVGNTATIAAAGAATYTWNGGPTGNSLLVNPGVTTTYNLSGTSQFGCLNTATVAVSVNTNSLTMTPATSICKGTALNLSALGAVSYTWSNGSNFGVIPVSPTSSTNYTVQAIDAFGCKLSGNVAVTVNNSPTITASASKANVCKGEEVTLTANGATTYSWSNSSSGSQVSVKPAVDVVYTYTVTGTDANGCNGSAVVSVSVYKCVGINEQSNSGVNARLYPNPASSLLTVEIPGSSAKTIQVMDMSGRIVLSATSNSEKTDLDVTGLSNGVYSVKVSTGDATELFRIVKSN